jgi:sec-independent protein translocase protein TatC
MTFWDHLGELRTRLIRSLIAIAVGSAIVIALWNVFVVDFFVSPYCDVLRDIRPDERCSLFIRDPVEGFRTRLRVGFIGGIAIAMPVVLWQIWRFITPALKPNERRWAMPFVICGMILFVSGAALGYWTFPRALVFFIEFGGDFIDPLFGPAEYFNLITFLMLSFGLGFEFPILLIFMQLAGIVDHKQLARGRRFAIVGIVSLAAIITPTGDPITLGALSVPLYLFYEASIVIGWLLTRKRTNPDAKDLTARLPSWMRPRR